MTKRIMTQEQRIKWNAYLREYRKKARELRREARAEQKKLDLAQKGRQAREKQLEQKPRFKEKTIFDDNWGQNPEFWHDSKGNLLPQIHKEKVDLSIQGFNIFNQEDPTEKPKKSIGDVFRDEFGNRAS